MNKYIFGAIFSLGLLVSPAYTEAASLTQAQVNAILSLLSSFGVDSTILANVNQSLGGSIGTEHSGTPAATPTPIHPRPVVTPTVQNGTGLQVSLSQTSPRGTILFPGQSGSLGEFVFTNPTATPIKITTLGFKRIGASSDSNLTNMYLYNGNTRLTSSASISASSFAFSDPIALFTVPAGGTFTVSVRSDIAANASGQQIGVSLASVTSNGTLDPSAIFPINGDYQTVSARSTSTFGAITFNLSRVTNDDQSQTISWTTGNATALKFYCTGSNGDVKTGDNLPLQQAPVTNSWQFLTDNGWKGTYNCTYTVTGHAENQNQDASRDFTDSFTIKATPPVVPTSTAVAQSIASSLERARTNGLPYITGTSLTKIGTAANVGVSPYYEVNSGTTVSLYGERLSGSRVFIGTNEVTPASMSDTLITIVIPTVGRPGTSVDDLYATTAKGGSNSVYVQINAIPVLHVTRTPTTGTPGTNYTVSWNSTNATSVSWSCTGPFTGTGSFPDASGNGVTGVVSGPFGNWIGTTHCVWTATGPGGSVSTTESFTVTSPVTMNTGKKENQMASALSAFISAAHANRAQESIENFQYAWDTNLQIGSPHTADVTALQTALTREGVYTGEITGGFYNETYSAVKRFQEKYGIESTGFVGPDTRAKLNSLY